MRVLLDECLPRRLGALLVGHAVSSVQERGWAGLKNGRLLAQIAGEFDVFLTVDRNMPAQQNLAALSFAVVVLRAPSNRLDALSPLVPAILRALASLAPSDLVVLESDRT